MENKKIIYIVLICIIIIGAIITGFKGLNFELKYAPNKEVEINIGKEFDNNDIKQIVKEVIGNKEVIIQKVELYDEIVSIITKEITDEQIEQINEKVNAKYQISNETKDLLITENANLRGRDLAKPFIFPIAVSLVIILVYAVIRFRKINVFEILSKIIGMNILAQLLYVSILAIIRIPINALTIPIAIAIYMIITLAIFYEFDNKNKEIEK